jgi:hypothetical protein
VLKNFELEPVGTVDQQSELNSLDVYIEGLKKNFTSKTANDVVVFTKSKQTEKLIEKINLPTRYMNGGILDLDSFLREKFFHIRLADQQAESQVSFIAELLDFTKFRQDPYNVYSL